VTRRSEWAVDAAAAAVLRSWGAVVPAPRGSHPQRDAHHPRAASERILPQQQRQARQPRLSGTADRCGSGMFYPDPTFFHPGSALKNLSILTQKMVSKALENLIRVVHPGSGC
jgi:hypothetical protein